MPPDHPSAIALIHAAARKRAQVLERTQIQMRPPPHVKKLKTSHKAKQIQSAAIALIRTATQKRIQVLKERQVQEECWVQIEKKQIRSKIIAFIRTATCERAQVLEERRWQRGRDAWTKRVMVEREMAARGVPQILVTPASP